MDSGRCAPGCRPREPETIPDAFHHLAPDARARGGYPDFSPGALCMEDRRPHFERSFGDSKGETERVSAPAPGLVEKGLRAGRLKRLNHAADGIVLKHRPGSCGNEIFLLYAQSPGRSIFDRQSRLIRKRPESGNADRCRNKEPCWKCTALLCCRPLNACGRSILSRGAGGKRSAGCARSPLGSAPKIRRKDGSGGIALKPDSRYMKGAADADHEKCSRKKKKSPGRFSLEESNRANECASFRRRTAS